MDEFMEREEKKLVPVPEELEDRIVQRISSLKQKRHIGRNIAAAVIVLFMLFTAGVRLNPVFASFAASIPGLKAAVHWLTGDKGIINARDNGYKGMDDVTVVEGDYTLLLQNIIMDEDRIYLSAAATGGKITEMIETNESMFMRVKFPDFEHYGASIEGGPPETFAFKVEKTFRSGELQEFLSRSPDSLKIEVSIYRGEETIHSFAPISVPLDKSGFMASKVFTPNEKRSFSHTGITIRQLTISPTRMRLDLGFDMEKGYTFTEFENPRLEDEKGNVYKPEGLTSTHNTAEERSMYFVPSIYFDKQPKHLYFRFDGLRIASEEGRRFRLALNDTYPKELKYMGQTITIEDIYWNEKLGLTIISAVPGREILKFQGIKEVDYYGTYGLGNRKDRINSYLYDAERKDEYELEIDYPGYFIPTDTSWEIPINR